LRLAGQGKQGCLISERRLRGLKVVRMVQ
jgi:hypothetical protein